MPQWMVLHQMCQVLRSDLFKQQMSRVTCGWWDGCKIFCFHAFSNSMYRRHLQPTFHMKHCHQIVEATNRQTIIEFVKEGNIIRYWKEFVWHVMPANIPFLVETIAALRVQPGRRACKIQVAPLAHEDILPTLAAVCVHHVTKDASPHSVAKGHALNVLLASLLRSVRCSIVHFVNVVNIKKKRDKVFAINAGRILRHLIWRARLPWNVCASKVIETSITNANFVMNNFLQARFCAMEVQTAQLA
mmetsp:Transcript_133468/g.243245  ORF Transcript_133468/g.243245 Transcript_133468/m.243245 type:complete len:245 (+) Transcript_133468:1618-2352(+)